MLLQIIAMSILSENMRYLRSQRSLSQQKVSDALIITRARYAKYEEGASDPPLEILQRIAHYFQVSIDLLISIDLRKVPMDDLLKLEGNRILLPIKINHSGDSFIEIIPHKAKAGYLSGYSDPEFIENLQHISLPFLRNGKYRAFPVEGDSMPPHNEGSFIIGRYIEKLTDIKEGKTYVLLTRSEGIVYKRLYRKGKNGFMLHSDNSIYQPYEIRASEILEVWEFACSLATLEAEPDNLSAEDIRDILKGLQRDVKSIKDHTLNK